MGENSFAELSVLVPLREAARLAPGFLIAAEVAVSDCRDLTADPGSLVADFFLTIRLSPAPLARRVVMPLQSGFLVVVSSSDSLVRRIVNKYPRRFPSQRDCS